MTLIYVDLDSLAMPVAILILHDGFRALCERLAFRYTSLRDLLFSVGVWGSKSSPCPKNQHRARGYQTRVR